jgi:polar amino acid transport system substrate-binding protein
MTMTAKILATLVLLLLLPGVGRGSETLVSLATLTDFAPYCFPKENAVFAGEEVIQPGSDSSQLQGYSWDIVRESFHAMGYTIRLYVVPWERAMHYLVVGKVDGIFPANQTVEREKEYVFSSEYVDQIRTVIYMRADADMVWRGLGSLNGLSIGFVRGWSYGKNWEAMGRIAKEATDTIAQGFDLVAKGRLAGVAGYQLPYDHELKKSNRTTEFKIVGDFDTMDEYLMGRKSSSNSPMILDLFDQGKKKIRENGVLSTIEGKWR